jgi:hypothetical protein
MNDQSFTANSEGLRYFCKLETHIITFFQWQFDKMSIKETQSIKDGLQNDNDILYVVGLDNGIQYHVVAAVQYVAVQHRVFVKWLAVENQG